MEIVFSDPKYLWLLVGIFILILAHNFSLGWSRKKALKFANFDAISKATRYTFFPRSFFPLVLRIFILVLIVMAGAGLGIWYDGEASDVDYMVAIDASGSMMAEDYDPNRLEAAKEAAIAFVDLLEFQTSVGVVSFAGTSYIDQPLTIDKDKVKEAISGIEVINVGGTAIGDAVVLSANSFKISGVTEKGRSIILLTDGQSNVGIEVDDAANYAFQDGIMVHSLAIATEEGGVFADGPITSHLDSETLKTLSADTGGNYYPINNAEELASAYLDIFSTTRTRVYVDMQIYLILIAFILLILDWVISNTRYKTII